MAILVTGGAGFIGSHLCDALLDKGEKVVCLDNLNSYYAPERKKKNIKHNLDNPNFTFVRADITNKAQLDDVFVNHKINKVVHLAARAGVRPSIKSPQLYTFVNVIGTINLLELAKDYKVENFIFGSSSSVYGENKKLPFSELDPVDNPISPYAASKRSAELYCHSYSKLYGLNITCLRFFTVYGPRGRPDMAPHIFASKILAEEPITMYGDGETERDYTYITDIIHGIMLALEKNFRFEIINLGNRIPVPLKYFIQVVEHAALTKPIINKEPLQPGDVYATHADISKAKELLGWEPEITIEQGVPFFVEWYNEQ